MLDADPTDLPASPPTGTAADLPVEAPKKATRRRATKAAAAPAAAPAVAPAAAPEAAASEAVASTTPPARAPRKRVAKAAAPSVAAATLTQPDAAEPAAAELTAAAEPVARAPRRRASKSTAPVAAPAVVEPAPPVIAEPPVAAAPAAAPAADTDQSVAPAPRTRRRATKAASAPATADSTVAAQGPAASVEVEVESAASARAPRRRRAASSAQATITATEAVSDAAPAVAADEAGESAPASPPDPFAVTFLAPGQSQPQRPDRTRRRATRPAGALAEVAAALDEAVALVLGDDSAEDSEDSEDEDEDAIESLLAIEDADPDVEAITDDEDGAADDEDGAEEAQSPSSRRRRRGRRGRGGRSGRDGANGSEDGLDDDAESADTADLQAADGADADDAVEDDGLEGEDDDESGDDESGDGEQGSTSTRRRRKRRRRGTSTGVGGEDDPAETVVHVREPAASRDSGSREPRAPRTRENGDDEVRGIRGSTRLEAKRQRRRDTRDTGRRRAPILTEAEFLARREAVDRVMALRQRGDRTQIAVLEDGILVEHYVTRASATSYVGNIYLGRVQNVLPSMEAAFVDIGKGRNGVLYAGEVNWDAAGLEGRDRTIQDAMSAGDPVLVQVTKDPIGHKGARLTSQITLPGRFLVYVPRGGMTGISRKLPDTERTRLKAILKNIIPDDAGVIIRTAAEGASEQELTQDVERLKALWESIQVTVAKPKNAPIQVHAEPDLAIRVVRDVFNEDFAQLVVSGDASREDDAWETVSQYVGNVAPELSPRLSKYTGTGDLFHDLRVDEQLAKALDRKVWLPSGGSLVIDRTEAMTVIDVNTGKFTGAGGNLEQTVTRNNIEAAEEIVRQLRLRDIGGMIVVDFIDMVLESNRDLVLRRLTECLGRDRTKHQVAEVTSLGLVQMTRKRVGEGLLEAFSEPCEHCHGRGVILYSEPVAQRGDDALSGYNGSGGNGSGRNGSSQDGSDADSEGGRTSKRRNRRGRGGSEESASEVLPVLPPEGQRKAAASVMALIAGAVALADASDAAEATDARQGDDVADLDAITQVDSAADEFVEAVLLVEPDLQDAPADAVQDAPVDVVQDAPVDVVQDAPVDAVSEPDDEVDPTLVPVSRPRRRRGASRPAGPPVHA